MRVLWVGDPHVTPDDLDDAAELGKLVLDLAAEQRASVVISGDLYHTHAIIHADVQYFWWSFFEAARQRGLDVTVIKGNHDAPGAEGSLATALLAHVQQCTAVLYEPLARRGLLFCPYSTGENLARWSAENPRCGTMLCHQTFDGSQYENGFFAGDGVDPALVKQGRVISGHIHAPQEFGKVWYPGAPRWRTLSDANVERAVWLLDFDDAGVLQARTPFDTGSTCRRILHLVDTEAEPLHVKPDLKDEYHVDSKGSRTWLESRGPLFAGWARWRPIRTDAKEQVKVKESDGVSVAFGKWVDAFEPKHGTDRDVLKGMVKERGLGI